MAVRGVDHMSGHASLTDILRRVEKLERAVFGNSSSGGKPKKTTTEEDFKGATGGLRLMISKGFFDRRCFFNEIETELNKQGYHYSKQAIQTPLSRLSKVGGPLVSLRDGGKKVYVKRK